MGSSTSAADAPPQGVTAAPTPTVDNTPAPANPATTPGHAAAAPSRGLPTHKLACRAGAQPPRRPVVLLFCGSFNPPTSMHLRCVELAADELGRRGYDVWGAYLSPVADAYGKKGLAPAADRVAMCRLAAGEAPEAPHCSPSGQPDAHVLLAGEAAPPPSGPSPSAAPGGRTDEAGAAPSPSEGSTAAASGSGYEPSSQRAQEQIPVQWVPDPEPDLVMVYDWEARQPGYTRTLAVLRRVESELREWLAPAAAEPPPPAVAAGGAAAAPAAPPSPPASSRRQPQEEPEVKAILLCGADVLASMAVPGVWRDPDVILREHGVVCVAREGTDLECLLSTPGTGLYDNRDPVVLVYDRVGNSTSSSTVRRELAAGRPVRHLVPPGVLSYIYGRGLYGARVRGVGDCGKVTNEV